MSLLDLNFDVTSKVLVRGLTVPSPFSIPSLYTEESLPMSFTALRRVSWIDGDSPIYERVAMSGYALQVSIGSASSVLASASTWAISADGYSLSGTMDLNTAGVNALADGASKTFEVRLFDGTNYYRTQQPVAIFKSVAVSGVAIPLPSPTALSKDEALAVFLPRNDIRSFTMLSLPTGAKRGLAYFHDDGSWRVEEIT